ncbi:MAG: hypothetical protein KA536_11265 [Saprospiraceae bacterium]|nr:hypothetical protein [Saprospiraceae bacterium]
MIEILEGQNIWLNVIFLFLAVLGVIATIVAYFKARRIRQCNYNRKDFNLIGPKITSLEKLDVIYNDKPIINFTFTSISIWNSGTEVINKSDFASTDNLRIISKKGVEILECKLIYSHNAANCFNLLSEPNKISIDFEFMATNEGIVIQLYHTGGNQEDIKIEGLIKGGSHISENIPTTEHYREKSWEFMFGWILLIFEKIFPNRQVFMVISFIIIFPLAVVTFPITLIFILYGKILIFLNPIPKEYNLENLNNTDNRVDGITNQS